MFIKPYLRIHFSFAAKMVRKKEEKLSLNHKTNEKPIASPPFTVKSFWRQLAADDSDDTGWTHLIFHGTNKNGYYY